MTTSDWTTLDTFSFGDSPELADELLALVLEGRKTATCWAAEEGMLTSPGRRWVVLDGSGNPRAIIETTEVTQHRFPEVDADFARDEGEGDGSLATWRHNHRVYFTRKNQFDEQMLLNCERFRLIQRR